MRKKLNVLMFMAIVIFGGCSNENFSKGDLPVTYLSGSYSIDVNDLSQVIGDADYVFVAEVKEEIRTIYKNKVTIETDDGMKEISDPYTEYSIAVIDNLKGNLRKSEAFSIIKHGGISSDNLSVVLYEDDILLETNKYYIISAYAQPDGSLLISGPNSNLALEGTIISEIVSSDEYKEYENACENEVITGRIRFKATNEE
ncbi:hypothetical protein [Anaerobium acetethylicum]|uniref:Uncharacterized protein n=1 Tax=Anaerobium acetethylicum TaxID=1619234 RepID=A0A1D3TTJ4_9FIRM|nr:hypothetical protein [Anaerobium acetethylicum]SCP97334.1 hypothetical protein SAMN05421730_10102 [Anaerobium acetethylicum]